MATSTGYNIATLLGAPVGISTGSDREALAGSGRGSPSGIESVIEYNGVYLNVRDWIDTFLVTTIGGIDDADVRDNREVNPGYHGEQSFPSYYGGRTITLSGKVYTHTLFKLRDMQQGLRQAFADLSQELPLVFRTPDPELDMMIYCKKSQPLQMADEQRTANQFERPFQIILRASNPRFLSVVRVHSLYESSNLYDFSQVAQVATVEAFDDSSVLGRYTTTGDGFVVQSGGLADSGVGTQYRNLVTEPDFTLDPIQAVTPIGGAALTRIANGGALDNDPYGAITSVGNVRTGASWRVNGVTKGAQYSGQVYVRVPSTVRDAWLEVEWLKSTGATQSVQRSAIKQVAGNWITLEIINAYCPPATADDVVDSRWNVVFSNTLNKEVLNVDKMLVSPTRTLPPMYFDGDSAMGIWQGGTPNRTAPSLLRPYTRMLSGDRKFTAPLVTAKILTPATIAFVGEVRLIISYLDEYNQLYVSLQKYAPGGQNYLDIAVTAIISGVKYKVKTDNWLNPVPLANTTYYFRTWIKGGSINVEWSTQDFSMSANPIIGVAGSKAGYFVLDTGGLVQIPGASALFEQPSQVGIVMFDEDGGWIVDEWRYAPITDIPDWTFTDLSEAGSVFVKNNRLYPLVIGNFTMVRKLPSLVEDVTLTVKTRYDDAAQSGTRIIELMSKLLDLTKPGENIRAVFQKPYTAGTNGTMFITETGAVLGAATAIVATDWPAGADRWVRLVVNNDTFTAEFWKTDPALGGAATATAAYTLTGAQKTKYGDNVKGNVGFNWGPLALTDYLDDFRVSQNALNDTAFVVVNKGNFRAQPVIEIAGPVTNLVLTNETNGEQISIPTTIPNGESWIIDIQLRRMYRKSDMANRFQYLDVNSDWLELEPGENDISANASGMSVATQIMMDFHHTVM